MDEIALVGGVLNDTADPLAASKLLAQVLLAPATDPTRIRELGFEPSLVQALRHALPSDPSEVRLACAQGAAWVLGRRSVPLTRTWELVASLPSTFPLPQGVRRTTAETLLGLMCEAERSLRIVAPYLDGAGMAVFNEAISAATARGVDVEVVRPERWAPSVEALETLTACVACEGQLEHLHLRHVRTDAPFAHLKVVAADAVVAYIGSANLTGAGLIGRNVELGVLVRGDDVAAIEAILDLYADPA